MAHNDRWVRAGEEHGGKTRRVKVHHDDSTAIVLSLSESLHVCKGDTVARSASKTSTAPRGSTHLEYRFLHLPKK